MSLQAAQAFLARRDFASARQAADAVLRDRPSDAQANQVAGLAALELGDVEVAKAFYGNAKLVAYEDWGYRATLEQRLKGVVARAALYADGQPGNDPVLAFHSEHACVMCHQR